MYELLIVSLFALGTTDTEDNIWNFGEGLGKGDIFLYNICDEQFTDSYTSERGRCYTISLDIKNEINIKNNTFYLIYAVTKDHIRTAERLFLVDSEMYNVRNIFWEDADYAKSLQNTIFWQNGWGKTIDTSQSVFFEQYNPESSLILSDTVIAQNGATQYTLSHDSFESSYLNINDIVPFPVSSDIFTYGPTEQTKRPLFSFELQNYTIPSSTPSSVTYPVIHNDFFEVEWR